MLEIFKIVIYYYKILYKIYKLRTKNIHKILGGDMKRERKFRLIGFILPILMLIQAFFLTPTGLAKEEKDTYNVEINLNIHAWDPDEKANEPKEENKESNYTYKSSRRQVIYWRIDDKLKLDVDKLEDSEILKLQKEYDALSIEKINEKFGKGTLSDTSKLVFNDNLYDEIDFASSEFDGLEDKNKIRDGISEERILIKGLEKGVYLFKETKESEKKANDKYEPNKLVTTVAKVGKNFADDKNNVKVNMKRVREVPTKDITLIKVDEDDGNIKLDKVEFKLLRKETSTITGDNSKSEVSTSYLVPVKDLKNGNYEYDPSIDKPENIPMLKTNTDGKIVVKGLPEGDYYFEEVKTIEGYDPDLNLGRNNKKKPVKLGGTVTIKNKRIPSLNKYDDTTGRSLDGVTFAVYKKGSEEKLKFKEGKNPGEYIYDEDGKLTDIETKAGGRIYLREMPKGDYYFQEITAIEGYEKSDDPFEFSVDENHRILVDGKVDSVPVPNTPMGTNTTPKNPKGSHSFIKVDKDDHGKKLAGAKFKVQKLVDDKYKTVVRNGSEYIVESDSNGALEVTDLEYGHYRLKEAGLPKDYNPVGKFTEFDIGAASSLNTPVLIENKYNPPKEETPPPTPPTPPETPSTPTKTLTSRSRGPLVKTGDIRIWIYFAIGLLMIVAGFVIVRNQDKKQELA